MRGRLAPSPTGALHLGNARSFLAAWLSIRARRGTVILRIEDLDGPRIKPDATRQVIEDLRWLGLDWDEGPDETGRELGAHGPYVQGHRHERYARALAMLHTAGLAYPCVCTRKDIERVQSAPHDGEGGLRYPGTCRGRFESEAEARVASGGRVPAWRLAVPDEITTFDDDLRGSVTHNVQASVGDFVIFRGEAAYQLAVVLDDAAMDVDEVVRGDDLLTSTHRQLWLYRYLDLEPPRFAHLPLVVGVDGRRLAKRHGDTRIAFFREAGVAPERIVGHLASTFGWCESGREVRPVDLLSGFSWAGVPDRPTVLDEGTWCGWLDA